jgi:hypothetical protein
VAVSQTQKGNDREVSPGGIAGDDQAVGAKLGRCCPGEPQCCSLTIIRARRIRVLRRQTVIDAQHGEVVSAGDALEANVVAVVRAEHPAAAVDVEVGAFDALRDEAAQLDVAGRAGNRALYGVFGVDDLLSARSPSARPSRPNLLGRLRVHRRSRRRHLAQASDELLRLLVDRFGTEEGRVERHGRLRRLDGETG